MRLIDWLVRLLYRLFPRRSVYYVGGSESLPPPLSREEEAALLARLAQGDQEAKGQLIERNLRLVVYIARKLRTTHCGRR